MWLGLDLEFISKATQTLFYVSGICVAWLTYGSAKRGLLNTVNTEYQKRVIERLGEVSTTLWSEFDREGDSLFYRFTVEMRERARKISELWSHGDPFENYQARSLLGTHIEILDYLWSLVVKWESDPFLPPYIRDEICASVRDRADAMRRAAWHRLQEHLDALNAGTSSGTESEAQRVRALVLDDLERVGYSLIDTQNELIRLRTMIQAHLQSYDPLKRTRPPRAAAKLLRYTGKASA